MITILAGGVGAARLLRGLVPVAPPGAVTAVVNTGDDTVIHGLAISPDLDTITYTLSGSIDQERGWGLADETWRAMAALSRFTPHRPEGSTAGGTWFNLGDRDLGTHLYRTGRLAEGARLGVVTAEIAAAFDLPLRLLPMSDDPVSTYVEVEDDGWIPFQDYFVGRRHSVAVTGVRFIGAEHATPGPGVLEAIADAGAIVVAPSNPIVSIAPLRAVPGIEAAMRARRDRTVAVSPIVAGAALKGPADRMLRELGHEPSVVGVARLYADIASVLVVDEADAAAADQIERAGMRCVVAPTVMSDSERAEALGRTCLDAVGWSWDA